jgi:hypothetical protein
VCVQGYGVEYCVVFFMEEVCICSSRYVIISHKKVLNVIQFL